MKGLVISTIFGKYKINFYQCEEDFQKDKSFSSFVYDHDSHIDQNYSIPEIWIHPIKACYLEELSDDEIDYLNNQDIKINAYEYSCPGRFSYVTDSEDFEIIDSEKKGLDRLINNIELLFNEFENGSEDGKTRLIMYNTKDAKAISNFDGTLPCRN